MQRLQYKMCSRKLKLIELNRANLLAYISLNLRTVAFSIYIWINVNVTNDFFFQSRINHEIKHMMCDHVDFGEYLVKTNPTNQKNMKKKCEKN